MIDSSLFRGDIVTPDGVVLDGGLATANGVIVAIVDARDSEELGKEMPVRDYRGHTIFPGVVDAHVHSFSDTRETFVGSTRAAAAGGVTTIIDMPYDASQPVNSRAVLEAKIDRISSEAVVDVALHGTIAPGTAGAALPDMVAAGVCGFKVSMFNTDAVRFPRIGNGELREILYQAREVGVAVGVHAEDGEIIDGLVKDFRRRNCVSAMDHCRTRPTESETIAVAAGVELAKAVGAPFHIFHTSTPEAAAIIERAKSTGADVSAETCPHYLLLDERDMDELGAYGKINPPLRAAAQVEQNWELLASGVYDMVTSDHAPWGKDKKSAPVIFDNSSGAPGVQTLAPLMLGEGWLGGRLSLLRCAEILASAPADRFGLSHRKGRLKVGLDADLLIFDPVARTRISAKTQLSTADWTPYEGRSVAGAIVQTVVRGSTVFDGEHVVGAAGTGSFIPGSPR